LQLHVKSMFAIFQRCANLRSVRWVQVKDCAPPFQEFRLLKIVSLPVLIGRTRVSSNYG